MCRSGVEPPTGTIHPRESRGTEDRKQKSISWRLSGFGIAGGYWAGVELSDLVPVGGCTPDRNDPPTRKQGNNGQTIEINILTALRIRNRRRVLGGGGAFRPCAGRGLNPRPERSTHAKAGEQRTENRNQYLDGSPDSELQEGIGRGWSFPTLCRSGVEPPTGTIHPRESRGTTDRKQKSISRRLSGFGIAGGYWAGVELSDLVPVGGCTPDRNDPPTRKQGNNGQKIEINVLSAFQIRNCIGIFGGGGSFRSGVQPPTGSRPDRHRTNRHRKDIILFWKYVSQNIIARKSEFGDQKNVIIQLS